MIVGAIFGIVALCVLICICAVCCCGKKGGDTETESLLVEHGEVVTYVPEN